MSKHVWLINKYTQDTINRGMKVYKRAIKEGVDFPTACGFTGYFLESTRQHTYHVKYVYVNGEYKSTTRDVLWKGAVKSKHRYLKGKNGENYKLTGRKILGQYFNDLVTKHSYGSELLEALVSGQNCHFAFHDWLLERGYSEEAELFEDNVGVS